MIKYITKCRCCAFAIILLCGVTFYLYVNVTKVKRFDPIIGEKYAAIIPIVEKEKPYEKVKEKSDEFTYRVNYPFYVHDGIIAELLRANGFLANVLDRESEQTQLLKFKNLPSSSPQMACRCGRISDPCICCLILLPNPVINSSLPNSLHHSIIIPPDGSYPKNLSKLCFQLNYLLKTEKLRLSATLESVSQDNLVVLPDLKEQIHSSMQESKTKQEIENIGFDKSLANLYLEQRLNGSLRLFTDVTLEAKFPPVICVINAPKKETHSNSAFTRNKKPSVEICLKLFDLKYVIDSGSPHKTAFVGCAQINIIVEHHFLIYVYRPTCFRMHRGAAADVDQIKTVEDDAHAQKSKTDSKLSVQDKLAKSKMNLSLNKTSNQVPISKPDNVIINKSDKKFKFPHKIKSVFDDKLGYVNKSKPILLNIKPKPDEVSTPMSGNMIDNLNHIGVP